MKKRWYLRDASSYLSERENYIYYGLRGGGDTLRVSLEGKDVEKVKKYLHDMCKGYGVFQRCLRVTAKLFGLPLEYYQAGRWHEEIENNCVVSKNDRLLHEEVCVK